MLIQVLLSAYFTRPFQFFIESEIGIDTICFFFSAYYAFHYAVFGGQIMLKNMLFALHYAKLF